MHFHHSHLNNVCDLCINLLLFDFLFTFRYTAVLPSLTGANRKFHFEKGDMVEKNLTVNEKLPLLEANVSEAGWFQIKGKRMFLATKHFVRPRDFFDMFANSRKYVMQVKRMEREEKRKLSKSDEN